jgi:hypothetical protein
VALKTAVISNVTACGYCKNRCFGGTYRLHHQDGNNQWARSNVSINQYFFAVWLVSSYCQPCLTLTMEATRSSVTSVLTRVTRRHIPEDSILDRCDGEFKQHLFRDYRNRTINWEDGSRFHCNRDLGGCRNEPALMIFTVSKLRHDACSGTSRDGLQHMRVIHKQVRQWQVLSIKFPPQWPRLDLGSSHVESVVDRAVLWQVSSEYFGIHCHSFILLTALQSSPSITQGWYTRPINGRSNSEHRSTAAP